MCLSDMQNSVLSIFSLTGIIHTYIQCIDLNIVYEDRIMVQLLIKQYVKSKSSDIDKKIKFPTKKA